MYLCSRLVLFLVQSVLGNIKEEGRRWGKQEEGRGWGKEEEEEGRRGKEEEEGRGK